MIFTALCCYTTSGRRFALLQAISRIRSAHASRTLFRCPLYNSDPVTKDLGTNRMAISSAQGTLRATAQLGLYLYLGRQRHRSFPRHVSFSAVSLLFMGYFLFIRIAQISCVHTLLPFHFVSPNASPAPRFWRSRQIWLNTQGTFVFSLFSLRKKDVSHLGWAAHKSVDQFWRSFLCLTLILLQHFLHLAGYHRLSPNALLRSSRHALWVSGRKLLFAAYNL